MHLVQASGCGPALFHGRLLRGSEMGQEPRPESGSLLAHQVHVAVRQGPGKADDRLPDVDVHLVLRAAPADALNAQVRTGPQLEPLRPGRRPGRPCTDSGLPAWRPARHR